MMRRSASEWREFEQLVARIEQDADPNGLVVKSPDRIRCKATGRLREVDASIRTKVGTSDILLTVECRRSGRRQDVRWIEQLAAKKQAIGAHHTIAVSSSGFSPEAYIVAERVGIGLRSISEMTTEEINSLLKLDLVLFWHKVAAVVSVGIGLFASKEPSLEAMRRVDFLLPEDTDLTAPIFRNVDTGFTWSINDMWHQLQECADPFIGIQKLAAPVVRTACFPYPGNVALETARGTEMVGHVLLSIALSIEPEEVWLKDANKMEYVSPDGSALQRVEFSSRQSPHPDWRISLQSPKEAKDIEEVKTGGNWPKRLPGAR